MDYEKKYKEIVGKIKKAYLYTQTNSTKAVLEEIFPEIKESEDELKWLTQFIQEEAYYLSMDIRGDEDRTKLKNLQRSLAWLKKQGKGEYALKSYNHEDVLKFMEYIEKRAKAYDFNLPHRGYDIYAFAKDLLYWLEKQDKQKPTLRERYENIAKSEWFKKTHEGMSISDDNVDDTNYCFDCINKKGCINCENGELKESEEEGSKKWILEYLYDGLRKSNEQFKDDYKTAIAWLEKQIPIDEEKTLIGARKDIALSIIDFLDRELGICLSGMECVEIENSVVDSNWAKVYNYILEKQSAPKPAKWSEKDEQHVDSLLKRLEGLCRNEFARTRFAVNEDMDWLESLKERY